VTVARNVIFNSQTTFNDNNNNT